MKEERNIKLMALAFVLLLALTLYRGLTTIAAQDTGAGVVPSVPSLLSVPSATIDLMTDEGTQTVKGAWRYSDTRIVETEFKAPGADKQPTGKPIKTYDYEPKAGGADFDDAQWEVIAAHSLSERRATGRLCFNWYRLKLTIPERVGAFDTKGATVVFQTALDDYADRLAAASP